jgi:glycyl-tRNA synthetase beta chain
VSKPNDLLIEIGTEELPPKALKALSSAFAEGIFEYLKEANIEIAGGYTTYATPRRLAVFISKVAESQSDQDVEKRGPAVQAAFDKNGEVTKAAQGFASSCGVSVEQLGRLKTDKGEWLVYKEFKKGRALAEVLPEIINRALAQLPIPKRMRWGNHSAEFVRPVHWVVIMHGSEVIDAEIMEVKSRGSTRGHRFHANNEIPLKHADEYARRLYSEGYVIADFDERRTEILSKSKSRAKKLGGVALIDEALLDEVTALNEWPVVVAGEFDKTFLSVPAEALIQTMQDNQKYFPVIDKNGNLKNCFITISNIASTAPEKVKAGNERVIRPRLTDAQFFWEQDQKTTLEEFVRGLDKVVFQTRLGSIGEKTRRVMVLAGETAKTLGADVASAERAALLSKADLMTSMVGEFTELQGIMGRRYAEVAGESTDVALALDEQYKPRGAGDETASNIIGQILGISDRIDTLVGIFAIGQKPTGEKDPYALRRATLGVLRTIIERQLDLDLRVLISAAAKLLADKVDTAAIEEEVFEYMLERLRAYYSDAGIAPDVFDAVSCLKPSRPLDFDKRIKAVTAFRTMSEAESLAAANKRVGNILKKSDIAETSEINQDLFAEGAEKALYKKIGDLSSVVNTMFNEGDYENGLRELSALRKPVDAFFDDVMVMDENIAIRNNRLALLGQMRDLFLRAADLSRLQ